VRRCVNRVASEIALPLTTAHSIEAALEAASVLVAEARGSSSAETINDSSSHDARDERAHHTVERIEIAERPRRGGQGR